MRYLRCFVLAVASLLSLEVIAADQPNVLLIMTDDQGYGDLSCHGNPTLKTPNLDLLHSQSIRFTDFHVSPFCTPSRAALMTGRYPARTGAYRTSSGRTSLNAREKTLGNLFSQNGYATGMFGKWHLGDCAPSRPMDMGFEKSVWHRCGGVTQISDYWSNDYFDDTYLVGDHWKKFEGYCTDVWFDQTMQFISTAAQDAGGKKPFFAYLATNAPHGPYLVADKWKQPFLDQGMPKNQAAFKGMVANFDWNMGRLMKFLSDQRLDKNTMLIFLTDNGTAAGAYDGGHRVPLFVRWPGGDLGPPRDIDTLAAHLDVTPTLMELCGLKRPANWPPLDGESLAPLMDHEKQTDWKPRTLHSQMHGGNGYLKPGDPWEIGVAMTERWRLVEGRELYDIVADPSQKQDVAADHPEVVRQLNEHHLSWFSALKESMVPTRIWVGSELENPTDLTSQEWVTPNKNPPWNKTHVVRRMISNWPWMIDVIKEGDYEITLSRWPTYIHKAIDSVEARIEIAGQTLKKKIDQPSVQESVIFSVRLPAGPTELKTFLTAPDGKEHGAYFASVRYVPAGDNSSPAILWTQYGLSKSVLKLAVHTDLNPKQPVEASVQLELLENGDWIKHSESPIDSMTAMATFRIEDWDHSAEVPYRVISGKSELEGTVRAEPSESKPLELMAVACINDKWFPYTEAVNQMIGQDPDLVFFAGDQIYESNAGGEVIMAETEEEVPSGMANYLAKWRKFGLTFRDLLKDRPSIMITDDHDVYANDLWGDGGRRMQGDRTTGGYPTDLRWVNFVEQTQTWHLPDAVAPGPWGDGVRAYFTSLDYGGVSFAILEDRKFKSPPSEVITKAVKDPIGTQPNRTLEVIMDPAFDVSKLERDDLQLLGKAQEDFVGKWALDVAKKKRLAAILTQSPFANIGNYDVRFGDMDANGWPKTGRDRALRLIAPSKGVMISGDIHLGSLAQLGVDDWGDGPWSYSLPAFSSKQNRSWRPSVAAQGREIPGVEGSGNHHDRFGNKLSIAGVAHGWNGYGMVIFDKQQSTITLQLHAMDQDRKPIQESVPGWPLTIPVNHE